MSKSRREGLWLVSGTGMCHKCRCDTSGEMETPEGNRIPVCLKCYDQICIERQNALMAGPSLKEAIDVAAQATILQHEGKKYLRRIYAPPGAKFGPIGVRTNEVWMEVDVYAVLEAFGVTCPAIGHAIKKLLCAGQRGKGDSKADLIGAIAAINRAIELEQNRQREAERGDTTG